MKKVSFIALALLITYCSIAQSLTESKEGVNSVLINGSAITFKITDPSLRFDFQKNKPSNRNDGFIYGVSAEGRNQSGIANIFSEGDLVPSARITGVGGFYFSNNVVFELQTQKEDLTKEIDNIQQLKRAAEEEKEKITRTGGDITEINKRMASLDDDRLTKGKKLKELSETKYTAQNFWKWSVFLLGGSDAKSFKRFLGYDPNNLQASFKNENFRGGFYGLGINYQTGKWIFGGTIGEVSADNQSLLAEQTFKYEKTTAVGTEVIKESKEIKAYAGAYDKVSYTSLNFDIVANVALDQVKDPKDPRSYIWINPYLRSKLSSSKVDLLPNTTNVGLGLYLFNTKSRLMAGIFVELPDVNNNIEKSKVVSDRNIRPALQKLSFGIVTRFNLETFINPKSFDKLN